MPYQHATSGKRALVEIERTLRAFGVDSMGSFEDFVGGEVVVHFTHRGRRVVVKASSRGYADAWLAKNRWTTYRHSTEDEWRDMARARAQVAVYSILRDWIKGQVAAVETGMFSFESAFLPHFVMADGGTVFERVERDQLLRIEGK